MLKETCAAAIIAVAVLRVAEVRAQTPAAPPPAPADQTQAWNAARGKDPSSDARFKVRVMEGVLERAVEHAAKMMNQQLRTVSPDLVLLTGAARARGYRLDGYGLFFDVQVPTALRQSMGWTVRMMRQNNQSVEQALTVFKRMVGGLQGKARDDAELALKEIELQVRPPMMGGDSGAPGSIPPLFSVTPSVAQSQSPVSAQGGAQVSSASTLTMTAAAAESAPTSATPAPPAAPVAPGQPVTPATPPVLAVPVETPPAPFPAVPETEPARAPAINPLLIQNPDLAYELEVREALIGAMVEWGATLPLQADEWLTVAARDNEDVVIPGEAADVVTIIMRVRGNDLSEFRAGRLSVADVRKRVEVREF